MSLFIAFLPFIAVSGSPDPMWVKIVPIVLSVIATLIALVTAGLTSYHQYFKQAQIILLPSGRMGAWRSPDMQLVFTVPMVLANAGAKYGVVHRISGTITMPDGFTSDFQWRMFTESKSIGEEGREFKPHDAFVGWAETVVIPARSAISKRIQFISRRGVIVIPGKYRLDFEAFAGFGNSASASVSVCYTLTKDTEAELISCVGDRDTRMVQKSVNINLALCDSFQPE
jgi:hypothetical protein